MNLTLGWCGTNFYPRPPRGGRRGSPRPQQQCRSISIHALREEGDASVDTNEPNTGNFYPRPPRGGRHFWGQQVSVT